MECLSASVYSLNELQRNISGNSLEKKKVVKTHTQTLNLCPNL